MNSDQEGPTAPHSFRGAILGGVLLVAVLGGAFVLRLLTPWSPRSPSPQSSTQPQGRPIVQIVRQQPGLPDLADVIDRTCPSVAIIVPRGLELSPSAPAVPASQYSSDGWLVTSAAGLPPGPADALFGDGRRVALSDVRRDPVSGLAIVKAADSAAPALAFSDQAFPRVGQFGFALTTPAGKGCSAAPGMIGSDFVADGGSLMGYVRLRPPPEEWDAGLPLLGADGRVLGIAAADPAGAVIPASIASVILDELIRNSPSASTSFGFRVVDYAAPFAGRLGDVRAGAGVALVQPKSSAAKAGLEAGDVVIAVDDTPVSSASELSRALDAIDVRTTLTVQRQSQQLRLAVKRTAAPS